MEFISLIIAVVFVGLLVVGRRDIARGANPEIASGAMLLTLAAVVGFFAVGLFLALNF